MSQTQLEVLKQRINQQGWQWRNGKPVPYGEQIIITDGSAEAILTFYPKRGRSVVGGPPGPLRSAVEALVKMPGAVAKPTSPQYAEIGMDESGKGDWFGPLVVAAVYLRPATAATLATFGVRDSKTVAATMIPTLAEKITALVPAAERVVYVLAPEQYNQRYAEQRNLNLLLAELYAEAVQPLHATVQADRIVCDQFAQRTERLDTAFRRAELPRPIQQHHAEAASLAVAAASILATAQFAAELERLGDLAGQSKALPRGASAIAELRQAARAILAREGRAGLNKYAKLNFKPIQELLASHAGAG